MSDDAMAANLPERYLMNVTEALRDRILPELSGAARDRLQECMTIIARVVSFLPQAAAPEAKDAAHHGALLDAAETQFADMESAIFHPPAVVDSRTFSAEKLAAYLRGHELGGPHTTLTSAKVLAGGRSKQTVLVAQTGAAGLPEMLVIRQDWSSAVTGTSVVTEFELLRRVAGAGLKAPMPLILETDPAILGSPFLVMQRMPGAPRGDIFHPPASERLALDLAQQLALLHALPVAEFDALGVPTEAFSKDQLRQGLAGFRETYGAIGLPSATINAAFDWLEAAIPTVDGARALTHNDLGCHNFLIDGEDLSAILDWELAHIGNPAADLGYIRNFVGKMTSWERFMAAYEAAGGPKITPETVDFYTIWCGVRLFCLLMKARAGVAMGMVQDTEITYACAHFIPQQHHVLSIELRKILS
jgi:aminoglycoside phosphotransferase (APT) family kinase protein